MKTPLGYALTPSRQLDKGWRVGYDVFLVYQVAAQETWLHYIGWSRTKDHARVLGQERLAQDLHEES